MKRVFSVSLAALALASTALWGAASAQRRGASTPARTGATAQRAQAAQAVPALPASDAVVLVEMRRLLNDALPRALASDAPRLASINADIDRFKTQTGIDPRAFETLAVGSRFVELPGDKLKLDHTVAVGRGTFSSATYVAAGTAAAHGNHREERHAGRAVHVFTLNERMKLFGLVDMRVSELAVAELDAQTLAVGEPAAVRAAIDASQGRGRIRPTDLAVLSQPRAAETLVAFGAKAPPSLSRDVEAGNPFDEALASMREVYGTLNSTAAGFGLLANVRTPGAAQARSLGGTLTNLKQAAPLFLGRLTGDKLRLATNAVNSLQITTQGPEVRLSLEIPQGDITTLVRTF